MPEPQPPQAQPPKRDEPKAPDDPGQVVGDVQDKVDQADDQGFVGVKVDPNPNEAYSLESGPDSPTTEAGAAREVPTLHDAIERQKQS